MKKNIFALLVFSVVTNSLLAQETVYFKKDDSKTSASKKKGSTEMNIIKISPLSFIAGLVPVYYERAINETFSIQLGAGITTTNYIKDAFRYAAEGDFADIRSITWNDGSPSDTYNNESNNQDYKNRKSTLGYFIAVEPRVYFESEGLDGTFMGLSISNARYNSTSKKVVTGPTASSTPSFTAGTYTGHETVTDILVNFGTQTLHDHISVEYNIGLGLRKVKGVEYAFAQKSYPLSSGYVDGESALDKTKLGFNLSIKVGYHF